MAPTYHSAEASGFVIRSERGRDVLLSCVAFVIPLLMAIYLGFDSKPVQLLVYLFLAALLLYAVARYGIDLAIPVPHLAFFAFFLTVAVATLATSPVGVERWKALAAVFVMMSVFVSSTYLIKTNRDLRVAIRGFEITGWVLASSVYLSAILYHFGTAFGEVQVQSGGELRAFGPVGDQVGFVLALFVVRAFARRQWAVFGFQLGALYLTATRGAFGMLAITLFVFLASEWRRPSRWKRFPLPAVIVAISIAGILLLGVGQFFFERTFDPDALTQGVAARAISMTLGLAMFATSPVAGVGFSGFREHVWNLDTAVNLNALPEGLIVSANNQIVQTLVDAGLLGFVALSILVVVILVRLSRAMKSVSGDELVDLRWLWSAVIGIAIGNQSAVWIFPDSLIGYLFFLAAGLGYGALRLRYPSPGDLYRSFTGKVSAV